MWILLHGKKVIIEWHSADLEDSHYGPEERVKILPVWKGVSIPLRTKSTSKQMHSQDTEEDKTNRQYRENVLLEWFLYSSIMDINTLKACLTKPYPASSEKQTYSVTKHAAPGVKVKSNAMIWLPVWQKRPCVIARVDWMHWGSSQVPFSTMESDAISYCDRPCSTKRTHSNNTDSKSHFKVCI